MASPTCTTPPTPCVSRRLRNPHNASQRSISTHSVPWPNSVDTTGRAEDATREQYDQEFATSPRSLRDVINPRLHAGGGDHFQPGPCACRFGQRARHHLCSTHPRCDDTWCNGDCGPSGHHAVEESGLPHFESDPTGSRMQHHRPVPLSDLRRGRANTSRLQPLSNNSNMRKLLRHNSYGID